MTDDKKPYPEGDIVGPCICGSWPGGKCLRCPRIAKSASAKPEPEDWREHVEQRLLG